MANSSPSNEFPQVAQAEENNAPRKQVIISLDEIVVMESPRRVDVPVNIAKKNSSATRKRKRQVCRKFTKPITVLDPWNDGLVVRTDLNTKDGIWFRKFLERAQNQSHHIDAWHLRKTCAILIPVAVEKDARSDIPEIDMKKYHVPGRMTLGEFILFIRVSIRISKRRPIFVSFKNTKPPVGALFYEIDEQNKGEDGFLQITYSGEENVCGSNEEQERGDKILFENEYSQEAANNPHATPVRSPPKQNIILMKSARRIDNIPDNNSIEPAMDFFLVGPQIST
ncbi:uncharacterized protein LOC126600860 isoform X3 [Malus sylvestris]|uniref:uncharacterized protein LOC126600860 isoform X3 n=1 Tax=Malus sylvestris TaxID=3752 RepID=UPI0021AD039C|nr:uncharacterized protein LOC126600860 isoform X3 [Malus sylvestris]